MRKAEEFQVITTGWFRTQIKKINILFMTKSVMSFEIPPVCI